MNCGFPEFFIVFDSEYMFFIFTDHPKCVLFITHGGLLSSIETVHFGVPTISVPIFFDQSVNSARAAANGYSITIHWSYNLAQDFKQAILEILQDKR